MTYFKYILQIPTSSTYFNYLLEISHTYFKYLLLIYYYNTYFKYLLEVGQNLESWNDLIIAKVSAVAIFCTPNKLGLCPIILTVYAILSWRNNNLAVLFFLIFTVGGNFSSSTTTTNTEQKWLHQNIIYQHM